LRPIRSDSVTARSIYVAGHPSFVHDSPLYDSVAPFLARRLAALLVFGIPFGLVLFSVLASQSEPELDHGTVNQLFAQDAVREVNASMEPRLRESAVSALPLSNRPAPLSRRRQPAVKNRVRDRSVERRALGLRTPQRRFETAIEATPGGFLSSGFGD